METAFYEIESNFAPVYQTVLALIKARGLDELYKIITSAKISVKNTDIESWYGETYVYTIYIILPVKIYAPISPEKISEYEKIFSELINEITKENNQVNFITQISTKFSKSDIDWSCIGGETDKKQLKENIVNVKNIMIAVATGKTKIQEVNEKYQTLNSNIKDDCLKLNIIYPNSYHSLWEWYNKWKEDFKDYQSRSEYLEELFLPILNLFDNSTETNLIGEPFVKLSDWEKINRTIIKIKKNSSISKDEEDFQQIGLLCREAIITLAQTVFIPNLHGNNDEDGKKIGKTDAVRMLNNYISYYFSGESNEEIRSYIKTTNKLANLLTHRRNATKKDMLFAVSATISLINFIGINEKKYT